MKFKAIRLLLLFSAVVLLVACGGGDSQPPTEEKERAATPSSASDHKTGEQTVMLGQARYDIECIDNELGMDRSNEIFDDNAKMTSEEMDKVRHCTVDSSEDAGPTPETNTSDHKTGRQGKTFQIAKRFYLHSFVQKTTTWQ